MKTVQISSYGNDVIEVTSNTQIPKLKVGELLIEVKATSINPFDANLSLGKFKEFIHLDLPITLGTDFAGVIKETNIDKQQFSIGQEVYGTANSTKGHGSMAEYTVANVDQIGIKPVKLDFNQTAALPLVGASAFQALNDHIAIKQEDKILIHGGAGSIGSIALQLAKSIGAYVAVTISNKDIEYVKSLGADEVIDYKNTDFSKIIKDYDAVFDTVGGESNLKSYEVIKPEGILVSMVSQPNKELMDKYNIRYIYQQTRATTNILNTISSLIDKGKIKIRIAKTFDLDNAKDAFNFFSATHPSGKVIIKIKD